LSSLSSPDDPINIDSDFDFLWL